MFEDTALHCLFGLSVAFLLAYLVAKTGRRSFPDALRHIGIWMGAAVVYLREVVQHQTTHELAAYNGLIPWVGEHTWSFGKQVETIVPMIVVLASSPALRWLAVRTEKGRTV